VGGKCGGASVSAAALDTECNGSDITVITANVEYINRQHEALLGWLSKQTADVVVLGLPMYNFGVPSSLKAYFDHVARAGVTFRYTAQGPQGLLTGKKGYVLATRGGFYRGTSRDSQSSYVRDFFAFLGIDDVEFIYAEGLAVSPDKRDTALDAANSSIAQLAA